MKHGTQALDLETMQEVAVKVHQLNSAWSEAKKVNFVKHALREYRIHRCCPWCLHLTAPHAWCSLHTASAECTPPPQVHLGPDPLCIVRPCTPVPCAPLQAGPQ